MHIEKSRSLKKKKQGNSDLGESKDFVIIGVDTDGFSNTICRSDNIGQINLKEDVRSYKFYSYLQSSRSVDCGIITPELGKRISLCGFIEKALSGIQRDLLKTETLPPVYLIFMESKRHLPRFSDFHKFKSSLTKHGQTLTSFGTPTKVSISIDHDEEANLNVYVRDLKLLAPNGEKTEIEEIFSLDGLEKADFENDDHESFVDEEDWADTETTRPGNVQKARACALYYKMILELQQCHLGKISFPSTLGSIGTDLAVSSWLRQKYNPDEVLGLEEVLERPYNSKTGKRYEQKRKIAKTSWFFDRDMFNETYHGGRNEQMYFGPSFEADFNDYDFASAYPTVMALIKMPLWDEARQSLTLKDFGPTTLGFAQVKFEFPFHVRYPTLPVRTENGLVFPRKGVSFCAAPEIFAATKLGAQVEIVRGVIIPTADDKWVFRSFIEDCLSERSKYDKADPMNALWKAMVNSTYGKTAQGLPKKRRYDLREAQGNAVPQSRITNVCFASLPTSMMRAALGEVMNALPRNSMVFSCTTDGFITDASEAAVAHAQKGPLACIFSGTRRSLTGNPTVLEKKHEARVLLGWKTRGQATLKAGTCLDQGDSYNYVLAKAGIRLPVDGRKEQCEAINKLFFNRESYSKVRATSLVSLSDILKDDIDCVEVETERKLNMEFDFKRKPYAVGSHPLYDGHLAFHTVPWETVEDFQRCRELWEDYRELDVCLKKPDELVAFFRFAESKTSLSGGKDKYFKKTDGDVMRLKQILCVARAKGFWGLKQERVIESDGLVLNVKSAAQFAEFLSNLGIPTKRTDIENGAKPKKEVAKSCPPTTKCLALVETLTEFFPEIDSSYIFSDAPLNNVFTLAKDCPFIARVEAEALTEGAAEAFDGSAEASFRLPTPEAFSTPSVAAYAHA